MNRHPTKTRLRQKQELHLHARQGMIIVAARGAIHVSTAPILMGEQLALEKFSLCEGEAHVVRYDGWIIVSAQADAEVVCTAAHRNPFFSDLPTFFAVCLRRFFCATRSKQRLNR